MSAGARLGHFAGLARNDLAAAQRVEAAGIGRVQLK